MIITLQNLIEINGLDITSFDYEYNLIAIIFGYTQEDMDEISIDDFKSYIHQIDRLLTIRNVADGSEYNGNKLHFNLDNIKLGEYIDLEMFSREKMYNNFLKAFFKLPNENFFEVNVSVLFKALDIFFQYQSMIFDNYSTLFTYNSSDEDNEDDNEEFISPKKTFQINQEKLKAEKQKKWGWISIAFLLARHDITKLDEVLDKDFIMCMNILTLCRDLEISLDPNPPQLGPIM